MARTTLPGRPPEAPPDEPTHWLAKPQTIRGIWVVFGLVLVGLLAGDAFVEHYEHFGLDGVFGFYAWYGFGSCVLMVLVAKLLGALLKRSDTYYREVKQETGPEAGSGGEAGQGNPDHHPGGRRP